MGRQLRRSDHRQQALLLRQLRRLEGQGDLRRQPGHGADAGDAQRRLQRHVDSADGSGDRRGVPRPGHSSRSHRSGGAEGDGLLLSAAQSGRNGKRRLRRLPAVPSGDAQPAAHRRPRGLPAERQRLDLRPRASYQHRDPNSIIFEGGNALTNLPILDTTLNTASFVGGWTKVLSGDDGQRDARRLQLRHVEAPEHVPRRRRLGAARSRDRRRASCRSSGIPVDQLPARRQPAAQYRRRRPERGPHGASERVLDQRQLHAGFAAPTRSKGAASGIATWRATASALA